MNVRQPRYDKNEMARRGTELYQTVVCPRLQPGSTGKFVAIDVETGAFEVGDERRIASAALSARFPDAQIWIERIGFATAVEIGPFNHPATL